jgi:hypothetical protein
MMITKKSLPRRTFLRGVGATVALPLLDSMVPALSALSRTAAAPTKRAGFMYVPNGQAMVNWVPTDAGKHFTLSPILQPLAPYRDQVVVVSGLANLEAESRELGTGPHTRCGSVWLNGVRPKRTEGADIRAGKTLDQYAADVLGTDTPLRSLEIALETNYNVGNCDNGYSCAYVNTFSWRTPTTPLPMENNPRVVFERLFGDGASTSPEDRSTRIREDRSILDFVNLEVKRLAQNLGPRDRTKLTEYVDSIRDLERRIQLAEQQSSREIPEIERPTGIPPYEEHVKLMFDLQVLAYQTDMTRVITFMMAREKSDLVYTQLGQTEPHHAISHNRGSQEKMALKQQIDTYHAKLFAYFLDKMQSTSDGDGSLLDHSIILYGSGLSDGDLHTQRDLPIVVAGGGAGKIRGGRYIRYPEGTPLTNLLLSLLYVAGVHAEQLGGSTGKIDLSV